MYKELELLAPAGSFDALIAAVQNGANAIYVGGQKFGARAFANNFDLQQLKEAVSYCHLRNVKLYVTVNTMYTNAQFEELLPYIEYLYQIHVDALIIQDMGLYSIIKHHFPNIEIHMSTQASVRNIAGVKYFEEEGIDRVVLARELTIQEIDDICHHCDIDIEVFVHGALCMSYSGQCLMSSMNAKRSGNRGECGQPCRLPYELIEDGKPLKNKDKYILSPQDLCTIDHVGALIDAGIKSFKIEGRMKRPEYVGEVVKAYRQAIDAHLKKKAFDVNKATVNMKKMFNRGFQSGFIFNHSLAVASDIPGNRGVEVGSIRYYNKAKKRLDIQLSDSLSQNDRIYFAQEDLTRTITKLYLKDKLVAKGSKGDIVSIELDKKINPKQKVYKIYDYELIKQHEEYLKKEHVKLPVQIHAFGAINAPLTLQISCLGKVAVCKSESMIEVALKTPLDSQRLKQQLSKLGNTTFEAEDITVDFPANGILSIKDINELRRTCIVKLEELLVSENKNITLDIPEYENRLRNNQKLAIQIHSMDVVQELNLDNVAQVFVPFHEYKPGNSKIIPFVPFLYDVKELQQFIESDSYQSLETIMVSDFGAYYMTKGKKHIMNANFNIANSHAVSHFKEDCVYSLELSRQDIQDIHSLNHQYFVAYSKIINMNLKHCLISQYHYGKKVDHCQTCKKHSYELEDRIHKRFEIVTDHVCNNYVLHNRRLYIDSLKHLNADFIMLQFYNEAAKEIQAIIDDYCHILNGDKSQMKAKLDTFQAYY